MSFCSQPLLLFNVCREEWSRWLYVVSTLPCLCLCLCMSEHTMPTVPGPRTERSAHTLQTDWTLGVKHHMHHFRTTAGGTSQVQDFGGHWNVVLD